MLAGRLRRTKVSLLFAVVMSLALPASVPGGACSQEPAPARMMDPAAQPSIEVATVKPNDSGATLMQQLTFNGHSFLTKNSSLGDLLSFAYRVQAKQITGAPGWLDQDRYDVSAVPDIAGIPNDEQMRMIARKLLQDRFKLTLHHETRELSAYVLTIGRSGLKMSATEFTGPGPSFGISSSGAVLSLPVRKATMADFAGFLQSMVLDRPVVDHSGLTGRFDFVLTFTPDDSLFNGRLPPAKTDATESAPHLFEAVERQLGLKLEAQKTAVDVIAIDHVEKPSAN